LPFLQLCFSGFMLLNKNSKNKLIMVRGETTLAIKTFFQTSPGKKDTEVTELVFK
jgi:hypothetical protein